MQSTLDARLVFSRVLEETGDISEMLSSIMDEANNDVLLRGVPSDLENRASAGSQVTSWDIDGKTLHIHIVSGPYVRSHEAVLRLRKFLGQDLGKKLKAGIRDVLLDEYRIVFELSEAPVHPVAIPFADELKVDGKECTLVLRDVSQEFVDRNSIDRMISRIRAKVKAQSYEGKAEFWNLMESHGKDRAKDFGDPTEEMQKLGWVKQGPTKGKWFYRPQAAKVFRAMKEIAAKEFLEPLGFSEIIESHIVPFDIWIKTGHMEGVPNEIYYVSEPKTRDPKEWEELVDHVSILRSVPSDKLLEMLNPPSAGVCYAQCPNMYWSLQGETIAESSLPVRVYDCTANSMRYESGGRHGIERVDEFHRIEPIYIGNPDDLLELRERMLEKFRHIFNDILEIEWRMAWVTPFYMQQSGEAMSEEEMAQRTLGTIDFEAYLPYRGTREESEWLEFQNLSIMGDKYTKAFNIKSQTGKELWSGCTGIGLERWAAVFLAQKGLNPKEWPEAFLNYIGKLPEGIKLL